MLRLTASTLLSVLGCANAAIPTFKPNSVDPSSYANTHDLLTTHFHLDLTVDFAKKQLAGTNTLTFDVMERTETMLLDIMDQKVTKVSLFSADKTL